MECSCDIGSTVGVRNIRWIDDRRVKAFSPCKCSECNRQLDYEEKHQRSIYFSILYKSKIKIYRICDNCSSITDNLFFNGWIMGTVFDEIGNYLDEGEIQEKCISRLTPRAREEICKLIENTWE